jgi:hypothetical protein
MVTVIMDRIITAFVQDLPETTQKRAEVIATVSKVKYLRTVLFSFFVVIARNASSRQKIELWADRSIALPEPE